MSVQGVGDKHNAGIVSKYSELSMAFILPCNCVKHLTHRKIPNSTDLKNNSYCN